MKQPLTVLGFGLVAPYHQLDVRQGPLDATTLVRAQGEAGELPKLDLALLERTLRRGLSEVTRLFMHAAKLALDDAGRDTQNMHVIFASAFGEIATAEALLAEAYDANGSSPARFRNSVHNTAAGLLSISTKNHLSCTAIAAGWETVPMALFEAAGQLASQAETVLLVFAEERVPSALSSEHHHGPLAAGIVLARAPTPGTPARGSLLNLRRLPRNELASVVDASRSPAAAALDLHPLAGVIGLNNALASGARGVSTLALSDGDHPWCVDVHARAEA